jgi:hypothetical protein
MPLSTRLVIGLLAVVSSALIIVGLATFFALRSWMIEQVDNSLMLPKAHLYGEGGERQGIDESIQSWTSAGAVVVLLYPDGRAMTLPQGMVTPNPHLLPASDAAILGSVPTDPKARPIAVELSGLGKSKAVAVPATDAGHREVSVVAVLPLSRVNALAGRLLLVEIVTVGLALLLSGLLSWLVFAMKGGVVRPPFVWFVRSISGWKFWIFPFVRNIGVGVLPPSYNIRWN